MLTSFETLEARTTIHFPRAVRLEELRNLFTLVSREVPCRFDYMTELKELIGDTDLTSGELLPAECYVKKLSGVVVREGKSASFNCELDTDYDHPQGPLTRFTTLRFLTTPGYDSVKELSRRVCDDLDTMDAVRKGIDYYFTLRRYEPKNTW